MPRDRVIIRLREMRAARVRYQRANLTITRWGDLHRGRLGLAIGKYEKGEIGAEELCWAFAKARVQSHTPTFRWDGANLTRVLELVVRVSNEPKFASAEPEAVAAVLVEAAKVEAEKSKEPLKKMRRTMDTVLGRGRFGRFAGFNQAIGLPKLDFALKGLLGKQFAISDNLSRQIAAGAGLGRFRGGAGLDIGPAWKHALGRDFAVGGAISRAINPNLFQNPPRLRAVPDLTKLLPDLGKLTRSWIETAKRSLPENWRELTTKQLSAVVKLMTEEGLSMAWAPREEIVRALLAARDHQARCDVLERNSAEIVEDVEAVLDGVVREDLQAVARACREAIDTYRAGHPDPAQAYAAAAIGELAHGPLGYRDFGPVRKTFGGKNPVHEVGLREFPLFAVGGAWVRVLARFADAGEGFNRNLTQHRIGFPYSEANLVMVLMLLAGLLMELQRALDRAEAHQFEEAA